MILPLLSATYQYLLDKTASAGGSPTKDAPTSPAVNDEKNCRRLVWHWYAVDTDVNHSSTNALSSIVIFRSVVTITLSLSACRIFAQDPIHVTTKSTQLNGMGDSDRCP